MGLETNLNTESKEEQNNYVEDVFKNMGFNMNLLNQKGLEEDQAQNSARNDIGVQPKSCKVDALLSKIPDLGFLTDQKLSIDELFI